MSIKIRVIKKRANVKTELAEAISTREIHFEGRKPRDIRTPTSALTISTKPKYVSMPNLRKPRRSPSNTSQGSPVRQIALVEKAKKVLAKNDETLEHMWPFNSRRESTIQIEDRSTRFKRLSEELVQEAEKNEELARKRYLRDDKFGMNSKNIKVGALLENNLNNFPIELRRSEPFRVLLAKKQGNRHTQNNFFAPRTAGVIHAITTANKGPGSVSDGFRHTFVTQHSHHNNIDYYHIDNIGYKNYKYYKPKDGSGNSSEGRRLTSQIKKKDTLESCIQSIYEQKMFVNPQVKEDEEGQMFENEILKDKLTIDPNPDFEGTLRIREHLPERNMEELMATDNIEMQHTNHATFFLKPVERFDEDSYERDQELAITTQRKKKREGLDFFKKPYTPNFTNIIVNKRVSFKHKQIWQEFMYYVNQTKKYILAKRNQLLQSKLDDYVIHDYKLKSMEKVGGISLQIFLYHNLIFKLQKKQIVDRILLALGITGLNKETEIVSWDQFLKFKRLLVYKDAANVEMVEFVIKFFSLSETEELDKHEFTRILRMLTDKVDNRLQHNGSFTVNLYDNFMENFKLAEVVTEEKDDVDFERFRNIYETFKMNILDIIDLISGAI